MVGPAGLCEEGVNRKMIKGKYVKKKDYSKDRFRFLSSKISLRIRDKLRINENFYLDRFFINNISLVSEGLKYLQFEMN